MPTPITHRATFDASARQVHDLLVDRPFLDAQLAEVGGKDPAVTELRTDPAGDRVATRTSVPVEFLPSVIRRLTGGDLVLDRVETWEPDDAGWRGTVEVTVRGLPGRLHGTQRLRDDDGGCVREVDASAEVPVPLVAGRIEKVVTEQLGAILDAEDEVTRRHLAAP